MQFNRFRNSSIKVKISVTFSALILISTAFISLYFPSKQSRIQIDEFLGRMGTVSDMVSLGCGVGLGTEQFSVIKNVFDWAKEDESLSYIAILNTEGKKITQHPTDITLDYIELLKNGPSVVENNTARFIREISYNGQSYGTILLGAKMDKVQAEANASRVTTLIVSMFILVTGIAVSLLLGAFFKRMINPAVGLAKSIMAGDYTQKIEITGEDEIGQLAKALNEMTDLLSSKSIEVQKNLDMAKDVVEQVNYAAAEIKLGNLNVRANAGNAIGNFRQMIDGFNESLNAIIAPMTEATDILEKVAHGDLTVRLTGNYQGDHAKLKVALNKAINNLDEGLGQVSSSTSQFTTASSQIGSISQSIAQGASEQASSLEEISSSLQEISSMTQSNTNKTNEVKNMTENARSVAVKGKDSMDRLSGAIENIKKSSNETSKIIKTIDEIAFQTNLLALNAAVEAARAGEAGKGFAVVAEEVRNLAMRSAEAARNTSQMIADSVNNTEVVVTLNGEVYGNLEEINDHVNKVGIVMTEIADSTVAQSNGIDQINTAISQLNKVTQQNAANSEESASSAEELAQKALEMEMLVSNFKLNTENEMKKSSETFIPTPPKFESTPYQSAQDLIPFEEKLHGNGNGNSFRNGSSFGLNDVDRGLLSNF